MNDIVTVLEAAHFLRRHPATVRRWIESKKLKARHLIAGGHGIYAILRSDLLEYAFQLTIQEQAPASKETHQSIDKNQGKLPL